MKDSTGAVDAYIQKHDGEVQQRLVQLREVILEEAPEASESISYGLVGYKLNGKPLVYFGGFSHHIGFYATPNGHEQFKDELSRYKQGKGSVQFPLSEPLPVDLIRRIVHYRLETADDN